MSSHERAATKHCTGCGEMKPLEAFSKNATWCKACINAYSKEHYQRNRPRILARKAVYRAAKAELISLAQAKWRERNVGRQLEYLRRYRKDNRAKFNHHEARRHATKLQATPQWADLKQIEAIYKQAQRLSVDIGVRQSVDHIYPLRGRIVCGLHVPENLRVIPLAENCKKRHRMPG